MPGEHLRVHHLSRNHRNARKRFSDRGAAKPANELFAIGRLYSGAQSERLRLRHGQAPGPVLQEIYRAFIRPDKCAHSVPFGFLVGNRGAMAGVGVSIGLAMAYLETNTLFEQMGNLGIFSHTWPSGLQTTFSLAGMYLILRMRS